MNDENEIIQNAQQQKRRRMDNDNLGFILKSLVRFIKNLVSMRDEIVEEQTIKTIKENMIFKGSAVWILVCSIIVASVGLNSNSVAVIIGAMLISPLMGPIRAIGLAVASRRSAIPKEMKALLDEAPVTIKSEEKLDFWL